MKRILLCTLLLCSTAMGFAQRITDKMDRGLIAMKATTGVYVSWRINAEEYYDVAYNVYRDGTKITDSPIKVSCFTDKSGTATSKYSVAAVVRGVEQAQSAEVTPWASSYKEIALTHEDIKSTLVPNDACCADVDGDGEVEILMKFDNESEISQSFPKNGPKINGTDTKEYSIFEVLKLDGTRLWWVNCGPNMGDFQNNEQNIVAYDWDGDGKAEALMRLLEGSTIHYANGETYTIGANGKNGGSWTNYRAATGGGTNWFMHDGKEFLVYCNGETGEIYQCIDFPLARLESGETDLNAAWGDGYGHRSNKFFFGAPYLDGHKPSIFLARGIYTRHKMAAYDVDPATHKLTERWKWYNNSNGSWKGQGFHNYGIADVDEDGRDEIVYGSMVIDDCGKGLSTTGLGHGDAQHCSDFNPYTKGLEIYTCNEDQPGNNYRDATTSKIYHRFNSGNDDGRAMCGNFSDKWPGSIGCSAREGAISTVTYANVSGMEATGINTNFRIYWDGDLCSETFNYKDGKNTEGVVAKYGSWTPIYTCAGSKTNNDTKGTPCYQGDILGDWREEIIMRTANNNIRIYSTPTATTWRIPSLWSDHQYRNAMVWQMCGYNQPPHLSYFIGKLEGMTQAPPPLTMTGREEVTGGGTIDASYDGKHVIVCDNGDTKIKLAQGAKPYILTINAPSWVEGSASSNYTAKDSKITYHYYTCAVTDGYLDGEARLVKQGDGTLLLPKAEFKHTGETNIWAGTLQFDGKMKQSPLWMNRFTTLISDGGEFRSIKAEYASTITPGGEDLESTITVDSLKLGFGSRIVVDLYSASTSADQINAKYLSIERKTGSAWTQGGPEYLMPVIELVGHNADGETQMRAGKYVIGSAAELVGSLDNIIVEGLAKQKKSLYTEGGKIILEIIGLREASDVTWTGENSVIWDLAETENFSVMDGQTAVSTVFVSGDNILFNDNAKQKNISITGSVIPGTFTVDNTEAFTFAGTGTIDGDAKFVKEGTGVVTMSGENTYTGGNALKGGTVKVASLSNQYSATGNLGAITAAGKFTMENGAVLQTTKAVRQGSPMKMVGTEGGVINNASDFVMDAAFSGTTLTKKGNGTMSSGTASSLSKLIVAAGIVDASSKLANNIEVQGGADLRGNAFLATPILVADKAKAKLTTVNRQTTALALTGTGQITVYCATEKGSNYYATRTPIQLNTKSFEGTLVAEATYTADGRFTFDTSNGGDKWTLNIPAGRIVQNTGKTLRIGQLAGTGTLGGGCAFKNGASVAANTWQVGNDGDFKYEGDVTSADKFTKMGAGKMTTTKAWTTTGAISINDGELHLNSGATLGTGTLTVAKGAVLSGASKAGAPMTNTSTIINGTLRPGALSNSVSGNLDFNGKGVTIGSTGTLLLGLRKAASTNSSGTQVISNVYITNIGTLKFNSGATIQCNVDESYVPTTDENTADAFYLWTNVNKVDIAGTLNFDLPSLPDGNYWDTESIKDGIIYVRFDPSKATGINAASAEKDIIAIYSANGARVASPQKGMNIIKYSDGSTKKVLVK